MKVISHSEKATQKIAFDFAKKLKGGETIGLIGDLGAGKTAFVKGLAKGLGIKKAITSPTFVVMKVYPVKHTTIKHLVHVDAYRVRTATSLTAIGLEDYIKSNDSVVVIEWANLAKGFLPKKKILIFFKHITSAQREIIFNS
ncbi:tRNA (adenosine(37)-N6)-threonylcarbamoyltransferase complex ATPase subunit type 1 TsaE [Candidatus Falkowbacteria bacterium]|nr:MAG: tRNA (adenosine(37)-N6)-threonylcarbamoyltransferase complex ATPase subunit type 1 TsaE [Candidatus Falkowbacteria bacterium]